MKGNWLKLMRYCEFLLLRRCFKRYRLKGYSSSYIANGVLSFEVYNIFKNKKQSRVTKENLCKVWFCSLLLWSFCFFIF